MACASLIIRKGTFHEPKTLVHKVQKVLALETDVPETANEMIQACRKMGSVGVIAVYAGYCNGVSARACSAEYAK